MKILQVVPGLPHLNGGGTEIYAYNLAKELKKKKHEVLFFYPKASLGKTKVKKSYNKDGIKFYEIVTGPSVLSSLRRAFSNNIILEDKKYEKAFKKVLQTEKPDVVHFHHFFNIPLNLIEVTRGEKIAVITTLHDYYLICPNTKLLKSNGKVCQGISMKVNCESCLKEMVERGVSIRTGKLPLKKLYCYFLNSLINYDNKKIRRHYKKCLATLSRSTFLISPSKFLREMFIKNGVKKDKIIFSENGYDTTTFKGFKRKRSKKIRFGYAGNILSHKAPHVVIKAFRDLKYDNIELNIYGRLDKDEYSKIITKEAKKDGRIKIHGPYTNVVEPYKNIDILIFPSVWYENCPLVLAEAQTTKTPVIGSNIGSIPEIIKAKKLGLLFQPGNPKSLKKQMEKFIKDNELITKFKNSMKKPRTMEEQAEEIIKIYEKSIQKSL